MGEFLKSLLNQNYLEYASYVIKERAIPHIDDGLKPVQRRILHTMSELDDGKFNKVANVVGRTMQYHPHGDASIGSALVVLANKDYFIDKQGNFGNIFTGDIAAAPRYIECRLTPLAKEVLFNKDITEFIPSYDGRNKEPVTLPCKVPYLLLHGADGIAVGMATSILPHNFIEVLEAQMAFLEGQPFQLFPDFVQGGTIDVSEYDDGNGKVRVRAKINVPDDKHLVIKEIPYGTNTEKLIASIEKAVKKGRIKISQIQDYSSEKMEIELSLPRNVYADQVLDALYAFTDCQVSHSLQLLVIKDNKPVQLSVTDVIKHNTLKLMADLQRELEIELGNLQDKLHQKTLEQIFIENRVYKQIEEQTTYEKVISAVHHGLAPFRDQILREVTDEDVERLLQIKIKRISRFDINKYRKEIKEITTRIGEVKNLLSNMTRTTIHYICNLLDKYKKGRERRTTIESFDVVKKSHVANRNMKLSYDGETGYLGTNVKGEQSISVSNLDKILIIKNGVFQVINVPDKLFVDKDLFHFGVVNKDQIFNCLYRDQTTGIGYMKRFKVEKFIMEREYSYTPENAKVLMMTPDPAPMVRAYYVKLKRVRVTYEDRDYSQLLVKGYSSKGNRVSTKPIRKIKVLSQKTRQENAGE
ncbi:MAG: DNA topoisomerase IV [Acidobacteria bacterium]|nr:MAG: DNA topoisomerase IV [Acidobacteriota bacterium]